MEPAARGKVVGIGIPSAAAIDKFIVDFYCPSAALVIELDGLRDEAQREYDGRCTEELAKRGLRVVGYTNDQILQDLDAVGEDILRRASDRNNSLGNKSGSS